MISIFLPPAMPLRSFTASSAPRMPSWPPAANGPSSVASRPILTVSCAWAPAESSGRDRRTPPAARLTCWFAQSLFPSSLYGRPSGRACGTLADATHCRVGVRACARRRVAQSRACPTSRAGRRARTARSPGRRRPITRLKRSRSIRSMAKFCSSTNTMAPMNGADRMAHAAQHGDDQDVDQPARCRPTRRDQAVVPDQQHAADRGDEAGDGVGRDAMRRDVEAERAHAPRIVADALERDAERRADQVLDKK